MLWPGHPSLDSEQLLIDALCMQRGETPGLDLEAGVGSSRVRSMQARLHISG